MPIPIVITRANDISFLGHLRTCGHFGAELFPVVHTWRDAPVWYSEASRFFCNPVTLPNPVEDESTYVSELVGLGRRISDQFGMRPFCLPSSDTSLEIFLRHEDVLLPQFRLMGSADWSKFPGLITDKLHCSLQLRKYLPRHVPRTDALTSDLDLDQFPFPAIIKPIRKDYAQTFYRVNGGLKALLVESPAAVKQLASEYDCPESLLIQEYIPFTDRYEEIPFYLYADSESNIRMAATGIKEHLQPAPFGTASVLRLSHHPELIPLAQSITKALAWRGSLMIEFIRDERDGEWKIIELNTRPWLFHRFYSRHGLDFVGMFLKDITGNLPAGNEVVVPSENLVGESGLNGPIHVDVDRFLGPHSTDLRTKVSWLESLSNDISDPYFEADDPQPAEVQTQKMSTALNLPPNALEQLMSWRQRPRTRLDSTKVIDLGS